MAKKKTKKSKVDEIEIEELDEDELDEIEELEEELEDEYYKQQIMWDTTTLIELSKLLDLKVNTIIIIEEDYNLILDDDIKDIFRYKIENRRIINRTAKNNLEDILTKLLDLYEEYTKNEDNRRSLFYMDGVELMSGDENKATIHFQYGT